jgi:DnaJ homolog subfamily C member 8
VFHITKRKLSTTDPRFLESLRKAAPQIALPNMSASAPTGSNSNTSKPAAPPTTSTPKPAEASEEAILASLEKESKEWDKDAEIARILNAFKLDAYAVLDLQPGVPESEIKAAYRKKSLLIHPDKTTNPSAPAAFDKLKKAQTELMDENARARLDEAIADARTLLMRKHKWSVDDDEMKPHSMSDETRAEWRQLTVEVLIDNEVRRRKQARVQMQEEGREQAKVEEEMEQRKRKREFEQAWENTRDNRIQSWRTFSKGKSSAAGGGSSSGGGGGMGAEGGKKKKKMKVLG